MTQVETVLRPMPIIRPDPATADNRSDRLAMTRLACRALFAPEQAVELRTISRSGKVRAGVFNDHDALATTAVDADQRDRPKGLYVTLNPVNVTARPVTNQLADAGRGQAIADNHILARHWLLVDIDASTKGDGSATDEELAAARTTARAVRDFLTAEGWPDPLACHSANGWHLAYRIALPNDEASKALVKSCLCALHARFRNDQVGVDTKVFNAARICKLYGTCSRKGANTDDRPWRMSSLLFRAGSEPPDFDAIQIVPTDRLASLAAAAPAPAPRPAAPAPSPCPPGRNGTGHRPSPMERARLCIEKKPDAISGQGGHDATLAAACTCYRFGLTSTEAREVMEWFNIHKTGGEPWSDTELEHKLADAYAKVNEAGEFGIDVRDDVVYSGGVAPAPVPGKAKKQRSNKPKKIAPNDLIFDPEAPLPTAKEFTRRQPGRIVRYAGRFYRFAGSHYAGCDDDHVKSALYSFLESSKSDDGTPFNPNRKKVSNVMDALQAVTQTPAGTLPPCWLEHQVGDPEARNLIPCSNGLLSTSDLAILEPTPRLFATHALSIPYDATAIEAPTWLKFLTELWGDDTESIDALQEWFGYVLAGDTRYHKMMLLVGPKRSGKGTVGRVLRGILGDHNVAAPTLAGLQSNFGMQALVDAPLAIIGDARLSGRADQQMVVERLLTISGEDAVTIDRKYRDPVTVQLPTRFMLLTNELPRLGDSSGALASRFIVLELVNSWLGKEDPGLFSRLRPELPAILNWSLAGWRRLQDRGRFIQPTSAAAAISELEDLGSPVSAFIRECCEVNPAVTVARDRLYEAWCEWCKSQGRDHQGTKASFGRDLRAAVPGIGVTQPRVNGVRERYYEGITLATPGTSGTGWHMCQTNVRVYDNNGEGGEEGEREKSGIYSNNSPAHVPTCASVPVEPMPVELLSYYSEGHP